MTTEEDYQKHLDENRAHHAARLAFADWLEAQGDLRAAGYRALAVQQRYPLQGEHSALKTATWWWHSAAGGPFFCHNNLPADWFALLPTSEGNESFWPLHTATGGIKTRRECEDAAALAFAKLPAERQAELLGTTAGQ